MQTTLNKTIGFVHRHAGLLLVVWLAFIFILCSAPGYYFPVSGWMEWLSVDKWVHAALFFILCVLFVVFALKRKQSKRVIWLYILTSIAYGMALEWMQANWFISRSFDYADMAANTVGCLVALTLQKSISRKFITTEG